MNLASWRSILRQTAAAWNAHEVPRLGAALAFYTILSLAPLLIFVTAVAALLFDRSDAQRKILHELNNTIGSQGAAVVRTMFEQARNPSASTTASVLGLATLLFGASGVFVELRAALNLIWDVKPPSESSYLTILKERFFSFGLVLGIGFLLLVALVFSAALSALAQFSDGLLPIPEPILAVFNFLISFTGITGLFAAIFKFVPQTQVSWRNVGLGAAATALLFTLGKSLIGLYLAKAAVGSAYGAAGSLIVIIVWVYYSAQIFFFGAEFTHVLALASTSPLHRPSPAQTHNTTDDRHQSHPLPPYRNTQN